MATFRIKNLQKTTTINVVKISPNELICSCDFLGGLHPRIWTDQKWPCKVRGAYANVLETDPQDTLHQILHARSMHREYFVILKLPARIEKKRAGIVVADDELQGRAVSTMALKLHLKQRAVVTKWSVPKMNRGVENDPSTSLSGSQKGTSSSFQSRPIRFEQWKKKLVV